MSERKTLQPLTLPLRGSHLIEASAGTGKTFTITLLYVRLVLGQADASSPDLKAGLLPQNLLVVTFTEAATKELRERIRKRLTEAAEVFAGNTTRTNDNATLFELRQQYSAEQLPTLRARLLLAAEWMDEAAISTIHGWCYQMLQEHAFDSGNLFNQTLVTSIKELQINALRDYYRTEVYPLGSASAGRYLNLYPNPEALFKKVRAIQGGLDSDRLSLGELLERFESEFDTELLRLKSLSWTAWREEIGDLLEALKTEYSLHGGSKNAILKSWEALTEWAASNEPFPAGFDKAAGFQNQRPERLAELIKAPQTAIDHPCFEAIESLWQLYFKLNNISEPLLKHAADWLHRRVSAQMRKRAELGFNDLLDNLHSALHGPRGDHLARQIRHQFPAALIDEFQDTDQTQYAIFDRIYQVASNDQNSCFVMIGDPKQAIYRFRGADIFTYLGARQSVARRIHTLGRNYRSHTDVVAAVNKLFLHADTLPDGAFLFGAGEASNLPFERMEANGTRASFVHQNEHQPALCFWALDPPEAKKKGEFKTLGAAESRKQLSEICASQIVDLLSSECSGFIDQDEPGLIRRVRPSDIAILVNNRTEAEAVRNALAQRQVKSVYLSDRSSVLLSKQAQELLHWIRAFAEPGRLELVRAALATPSLALEHAQLEAFNCDEIELGKVLEQFEGYQLSWQVNGLYATLRRFLNDYKVPAKLLARQDERALTDLLHLAELLQAASMQLDGEHALIRYYEQMLLTADEESEHLNMRLESDANLVQVVTVHKSKGLEYPLVFLPFGTSLRSELKSKDPVRFHNSEQQWVTKFNPSDEELIQADRERLAEDLRKLYVALTRAKYAMWIGAPATENWHISALGYALGMAQKPKCEISPALRVLEDGRLIRLCEPRSHEQAYAAGERTELGEALKATQKLEQNWWIASYSRIQYESRALGDIDDSSAEKRADEHDVEPLAVEAGLQLNGYHAFIKGAGPGDFLHSILEWCSEQHFNRIIHDPQRLLQEISRRCETKNSPDYDPQLINRWVLDLLSQPFSLPDGSRCSLAQLSRAKAEMEFWFEVNSLKIVELDELISQLSPTQLQRPAAKDLEFNGMLKGFIDLTFEHQGRYYVLDYKSTFIGPDDSAYNLEMMQRKTLEKRYDLQYMIYTLALHRYLRSRLPEYDYETHIGGALVMYLRGINSESAGVLADRPPKELIERMDSLFRGGSR